MGPRAQSLCRQARPERMAGTLGEGVNKAVGGEDAGAQKEKKA